MKTVLAQSDGGSGDEPAGLADGNLRTLIHYGRPVLFITLLCLAAGVWVSSVDGVAAAVFFLAGGSALVSFVLLARRQ
jgi:hypothetical protein